MSDTFGARGSLEPPAALIGRLPVFARRMLESVGRLQTGVLPCRLVRAEGRRLLDSEPVLIAALASLPRLDLMEMAGWLGVGAVGMEGVEVIAAWVFDAVLAAQILQPPPPLGERIDRQSARHALATIRIDAIRQYTLSCAIRILENQIVAKQNALDAATVSLAEQDAAAFRQSSPVLSAHLAAPSTRWGRWGRIYQEALRRGVEPDFLRLVQAWGRIARLRPPWPLACVTCVDDLDVLVQILNDTFEGRAGLPDEETVGAVTYPAPGIALDALAAIALYLREVENESQWYRHRRLITSSIRWVEDVRATSLAPTVFLVAHSEVERWSRLCEIVRYRERRFPIPTNILHYIDQFDAACWRYRALRRMFITDVALLRVACRTLIALAYDEGLSALPAPIKMPFGTPES